MLTKILINNELISSKGEKKCMRGNIAASYAIEDLEGAMYNIELTTLLPVGMQEEDAMAALNIIRGRLLFTDSKEACGLKICTASRWNMEFLQITQALHSSNGIEVHVNIELTSKEGHEPTQKLAGLVRRKYAPTEGNPFFEDVGSTTKVLADHAKKKIISLLTTFGAAQFRRAHPWDAIRRNVLKPSRYSIFEGTYAEYYPFNSTDDSYGDTHTARVRRTYHATHSCHNKLSSIYREHGFDAPPFPDDIIRALCTKLYGQEAHPEFGSFTQGAFERPFAVAPRPVAC